MGIRVWKNVVRKGDVVVDATCGNGYDTLAMARLIADDTRTGCVLAMDLQKDALESTSSLLDRSLTADEVLFSCSLSDHIPTTDFAINYIDHICISYRLINNPWVVLFKIATLSRNINLFLPTMHTFMYGTCS